VINPPAQNLYIYQVGSLEKKSLQLRPYYFFYGLYIYNHLLITSNDKGTIHRLLSYTLLFRNIWYHIIIRLNSTVYIPLQSPFGRQLTGGAWSKEQQRPPPPRWQTEGQPYPTSYFLRKTFFFIKCYYVMWKLILWFFLQYLSSGVL